MPLSPASELSEELYALMQEDYGATVEAIRRMWRLMSLNCVRAGVPELSPSDAFETGVAVNARKVLLAATADLAKPPDEREPIDEVDNGAAARIYLALEPGTETLLLKDRRQRATLYTGDKDVRAMAKTQDGRKSHEYRLMASLAASLIDREVTFVARNRPVVPPPELVAVHHAWRAVHRLSYQLGLYSTFHNSLDVSSWGGFINDTLALFGHMWQLVEAPDEHTLDEIGPDQPPTVEQTPPQLLYLLRLTSPFSQADLVDLSRCIRPGLPLAPPDLSLAEDVEISTSSAIERLFVRPTPDDEALIDDLLGRWQKWADGCICKVVGDYWGCRQHRFRRALDLYQGKLEECWAYLRDPMHSPGEYDRAVVAAERLAQYGIRLPVEYS